MRLELRGSAVILVLFMAGSWNPSVAGAAWQVNGTPVCTTPGQQAAPAVFSDGTHGAVVSWVDGIDSWSIHCQRVDSAGGTAWGTGGIEVLPVGEWSFYHANSDGAGGLLCGFECAGGTPSNPGANDICVKHVTSGGILEVWQAACTDTSDQYRPWVCPTTNGYWSQAYAVWDDRRDADTRVYLQGCSSGSTLWPDGLLVGGYPGAALQNLRAFASEDDAAIVAWNDMRNGDWDIFAQCVLPFSGSLLWGEYGTTVFAGTGTQTLSRFVTDGNLGAIVLWTDAAKYLFAQRLNAYGWLMWGESGDTISSSGYADRGLLIFDGKDGGIVSWREGPSAGPRTLRVQRIDASGNSLWGVDGVAVAPASTAPYQQIATDGAGGVIVAWTELISGYYVIQAQRVDSSGVVAWGPAGVLVRSLPSIASIPVLVSDGSNGAIIVWEDDRSDAGDIYAARIAADGTTTDVAARPASTPLATRIEGNVPNPFNPVTRITYSIAASCRVTLRVYDVTGRLTRTLFEGWHQAGTYGAAWNGKNEDGLSLPSGVYFCRLEAGDVVADSKLVMLR